MVDLSGYDHETLLRWWHEFNGFRWPVDFPAPEPSGWQSWIHGKRGMEWYHRFISRFPELSIYMKHIEKLIPGSHPIASLNRLKESLRSER